MVFFAIYLLGLAVCTLSHNIQEEQLPCSDLLRESCGICAAWKEVGYCEITAAKLLCLETCGHCKKDENRSVLGVHYKGCYRDGFVSDFETMVPMERQYLGVQSCTSKCHMKGYPFAALQDAKFCMCSQHQSRSYGMAQDESECMTRCPGGSENDRCGGPWTNAVYEIAKQKLYNGGLRMRDVAERLHRAFQEKQKSEPESQTPGRLSDQLDLLRKTSYK